MAIFPVLQKLTHMRFESYDQTSNFQSVFAKVYFCQVQCSSSQNGQTTGCPLFSICTCAAALQRARSKNFSDAGINCCSIVCRVVGIWIILFRTIEDQSVLQKVPIALCNICTCAALQRRASINFSDGSINRCSIVCSS